MLMASADRNEIAENILKLHASLVTLSSISMGFRIGRNQEEEEKNRYR